MRICFIVADTRPSGGISVVRGHAERLGASVVLPEEALAGEWDMAVGTWWETAEHLFRVPAKRRAMFLQSAEHRFYGDDEPLERLGAAAVLGLPLDYLVVAGWMVELLAEVRPDARVHLVPPGVDKAVFGRRASGVGRRDQPLRVLVEGQPNLPFKGVADALEAVRLMREPVSSTLVALDPSRAEGLGADRVEGGLDPAGMAALYAEHDVLLKMSRIESLGLPPIEAMHVGTTAVVTPYTGHEEYMRHGENGAVVGFDDPPAAAAWLDRLATDRELLPRLGEGALATAAKWPSAERSSELMGAALEAVAAAPEPDPAPAAAALLDGLRADAKAARFALLEAEARAQDARFALLEAETRAQDAGSKLEQVGSGPAVRATRALRRRLGR